MAPSRNTYTNFSKATGQPIPFGSSSSSLSSYHTAPTTQDPWKSAWSAIEDFAAGMGRPAKAPTAPKAMRKDWPHHSRHSHITCKSIEACGYHGASTKSSDGDLQRTACPLGFQDLALEHQQMISSAADISDHDSPDADQDRSSPIIRAVSSWSPTAREASAESGPRRARTPPDAPDARMPEFVYFNHHYIVKTMDGRIERHFYHRGGELAYLAEQAALQREADAQQQFRDELLRARQAQIDEQIRQDRERAERERYARDLAAYSEWQLREAEISAGQTARMWLQSQREAREERQRLEALMHQQSGPNTGVGGETTADEQNLSRAVIEEWRAKVHDMTTNQSDDSRREFRQYAEGQLEEQPLRQAEVESHDHFRFSYFPKYASPPMLLPITRTPLNLHLGAFYLSERLGNSIRLRRGASSTMSSLSRESGQLL